MVSPPAANARQVDRVRSEPPPGPMRCHPSGSVLQSVTVARTWLSAIADAPADNAAPPLLFVVV